MDQSASAVLPGSTGSAFLSAAQFDSAGSLAVTDGARKHLVLNQVELVTGGTATKEICLRNAGGMGQGDGLQRVSHLRPGRGFWTIPGRLIGASRTSQPSEPKANPISPAERARLCPPHGHMFRVTIR